jgi:nicotinamide N-methyltransferase
VSKLAPNASLGLHLGIKFNKLDARWCIRRYHHERSPIQPFAGKIPGLGLIVVDGLQHDALLKTCDQTLVKRNAVEGEWTPCVLVFFTHHRPWLADKDMEFFTKAQAAGWHCEQVVKSRMSVSFCGRLASENGADTLQAMFMSDPGDEEVRATVNGWRMWRAVT